MENLSKQDQEFVKEVAITGNQTKSAKKAYGITSDDYARKKGSVQVAKGHINTAIAEVKKSLAERVSIDKLEQVLNEGLEAYKTVKVGQEGDESVEPDFAVRHKYLDSSLKIIGAYAPEKSINLNLNGDVIPNEELETLAQQLNEIARNNIRTSIRRDGADTEPLGTEIQD